MLCGDIQEAFPQIQIKEGGGNAIRFHRVERVTENLSFKSY